MKRYEVIKFPVQKKFYVVVDSYLDNQEIAFLDDEESVAKFISEREEIDKITA